jgi:hypothetical protein
MGISEYGILEKFLPESESICLGVEQHRNNHENASDPTLENQLPAHSCHVDPKSQRPPFIGSVNTEQTYQLHGET